MLGDQNDGMRRKIEGCVIGSKILSFTVEGHTIQTDGPSKTVLEFDGVVDFLLTTGGWKFVPTGNPGRPPKRNPEAIPSC